MTRESEKSKIRMSVIVDGKHINSLKKADEVIDQIFDDHEAQLKAKEEEISKYQMAIDKQSKRAEALKQLSLDKDKEIERLKEFEEMVEWMELNSNRSLCDYYNNKDNS